ncbi:MAG: spore germination protein [Firmicutes bacterium]|nr:spore germination protein [Bacillota bacterium]
MKISSNFDENVQYFREAAVDCPDYIINELKLKDGTKLLLFFIDNMVNTEVLYMRVLPKIMETDSKDFMLSDMPFAAVTITTTLEDALTGIGTGGVFFLLEGKTRGFQVRIEKLVGRLPSSTETEKNIRGAKDSFVENLRINMAIMRTKICNHNLKFKQFSLGSATQQTAAIAYIKGIADEGLLNELGDRLKKLNYDGYLDTAYVEQMISEHPHSPFPQCNMTERTDKAEAALLEGRLVLFLTGSPNVIILPANFWSFFHAIDDYNHPPAIGSIIGILRFAGMFISLFLPAAYIAVLSYHYYVVPLNILSNLASSRTLVIFTPLVEAFIMEFLFEIIREASVRLPTYIGGTIGIVGGIIIGQAAVEAGIVSNLMVIVVAITAIAGFVIPSQDMSQSLRFTRFFIMLFAGIFGICGLVIAASLLLIYLLQLRSLGRPYLMPLSPLRIKGWYNTIIRMPFTKLRRRSSLAKPADTIRGYDHER